MPRVSDTAPVELATKGALLAASGGSPVLRGEVPLLLPRPALWLADDQAWAVAFLRPTYAHGRTVMLHAGDVGDQLSPDALARLVDLAASARFARWLASAREVGADGVSVPRAARTQLSHLLPADPRATGSWEWMETDTSPPAVGTPVVELSTDDRPEVEALLATDNPRTDGQPFARPGQRWVGVREERRLLAVGCCEAEISGAPALAGITVSAPARGRGLGRAVTADLTRRAIAEHGWCTLGMYSDNTVARRLYLDLGYRVRAWWTSARLAGTDGRSGG